MHECNFEPKQMKKKEVKRKTRKIQNTNIKEEDIKKNEDNNKKDNVEREDVVKTSKEKNRKNINEKSTEKDLFEKTFESKEKSTKNKEKVTKNKEKLTKSKDNLTKSNEKSTKSKEESTKINEESTKSIDNEESTKSIDNEELTYNNLKEELLEKKNFLLKSFKSKLEGIFSQLPEDILKLPVLSIKDALNIEYSGEEVKIVDTNKKLKRESTVSLTFGEEYTYDGRTFLDSKGKVKNESLDQNLKDLLKNAKKIADRMGKDMSLFIE